MEITQKQKVLNRLKETGSVDNFWAIQNYILRLGAIIHALTKEGYRFQDRSFGTGKDRKNYSYSLKETGCCPDMDNFKQHFGVCKNQVESKGLF